MMSILMLSLLGCELFGSDSADTAEETERDALIEELSLLLPAWDRAYLEVPLEAAVSMCDDADLSSAVETLTCHNDVDLPEVCEEGDEDCYAELSDECAALLDVRDACVIGYTSHFTPEELTEKIVNLHPDDCDRSLKGIYLAEAAYEDGEAGIQAYLSGKSELADYELLGVYDGGAAGGQVLMAISWESDAEVCHVSFKGSSDPVDWIQDLSSINLTDCPASDGTSMGQCGAGFIDQYAALRDAGAVQEVLNGLDNSCDGGLYIYGHSLGGAEASLLTAELLTLRPGDAERIHTYTYGEPRTFATADGDAYQDASHKVRWMHWGDPVPSLPPTSSGFKHFGDARELTSHWFGEYYITQQKQDAATYSPDPSNHYTASYIENLKACK